VEARDASERGTWEFRVLGPLEIIAGGRPVPTGSHKQRTVLAMLLINAGNPVSLDDLIDELWEQDPPASAVANVRTYAANLRRLLASEGGGRTGIARRGSGYLLTLGPGELDLAEYERALAAARTARNDGDPARVADLLIRADGLWRGSVLEDVHLGGALTSHRAALTELRLGAVDDCATALLEAGDAGAAVAMLREQIRRQPLREPSVAILMRALHQAGDLPGATAAFNRLRADLVAELGVEPGEELQALCRSILRRESAGEAAPGRAPRPATVPRQLPPVPVTFVGRHAEQDRLMRVLQARAGGANRCVVTTIHGRGGVGKSALAVWAAHEVADRFPDGQVYVDLQGATPGLRPRTVREALDHCLRAVGVAPHEVPPDDGDAAALFRSAVAQRRLLLLLDNATDASQVAPLIPAGPGCAVIVTSRGILATLDAHLHVGLEGLSPAEAVELIDRTSTGRAQTAGDLVAVAGFCEHLPLALRIVGARLASRSDLTARELGRRLSDQRRRLDELGFGGLAVRASIRIGYDALRASDDETDLLAAASFRMLGLLNIPEPEPGVVAAMLDRGDPVPAIGRALDRLVECRLLDPARLDGYVLHDLVRLVAMECADEEIPPARRGELVHRGLTYLIGGVRRAHDLVRPGRRRADRDFAVPDDLALVEMDDLADALRWLDGALPNLLAAAEQSVGLSGEDRRFTVRLIEGVRGHLDKRAAWTTLTGLAQLALDVAEADGDPSGAAQALNTLAMADLQQGRYASAEERLGRVIVIYSAIPEPDWLANTYNTLALVAKASGDLLLALERLRRCAELTREHNLPVLEPVVAHNTGEIHLLLRDWTSALQSFRDSLAGKRRAGDLSGITVTLNAMGVAACQLGDYGKAVGWLDEGLRSARERGQPSHEFMTLVVRSEAHLRAGAPQAALADARAALPVARAAAHDYWEAVALRQLSAATAACGDAAAAALLAGQARVAFATLQQPADPILEHLLGQHLDTGAAAAATR
jgi:DNA-binding SARP family transcriptional activator/tetratricopeptide (TPR) repeat protein